MPKQAEFVKLPIDVRKAKQLLGWSIAKGKTYHIKDLHGNKIWCKKNATNRPIRRAVIDSLKQEHLRQRWCYNGEPIIVGREGNLLNGQHSLIALVLAEQEVELHPRRWKHLVGQKLTMLKLIVYGIDESDHVVNTIDTSRSRTFSDVVYRSQFTEGLKGKKSISRIVEHAIRLLWLRTGQRADALAPRTTHSEMYAFLERHPRLMEAAEFISARNTQAFRQYVSPGYAAGFLYLMGCSTTPAATYYEGDRSEQCLDWGYWDLALGFWDFEVGAQSVFPLLSLLSLAKEENTPTAYQWALIVKAWIAYEARGKVNEKDLKLKYRKSASGRDILDECPTVGGIDLGGKAWESEEKLSEVPVAPVEVEAVEARRTSQVVAVNQHDAASIVETGEPEPSTGSTTESVKRTYFLHRTVPDPKKRKRLEPSIAGDDWAVGDVAYAVEPGMSDDPCLGKIIEIWEADGGPRALLQDESGNRWNVAVDSLQIHV